MAQKNESIDREELLADIAEMYYQEGMTQSEISERVGMTRSAISRLLTEARQKGIVEIHVHRPVRYDRRLAHEMMDAFNLRVVQVVIANPNESYQALQQKLGRAAASFLELAFRPYMTIGVGWGTTINHVIDAYAGGPRADTRVVQLLGVLGATRHSYSGQTLVENLARKLGGEGVFLYTPFMVDSEATAKTLMEDPSIKEALSVAKQADIALLGIGSTKPEYCSLLQGGHITKDDLTKIIYTGAVGDVNGIYFNARGFTTETEFHKRTVGLKKDDLLRIPTRFAVAGGLEKAKAILGAINGGLINELITDHQTAIWMLSLDNRKFDPR